jgi:MarR family transcriptional regulator for hemolysin
MPPRNSTAQVLPIDSPDRRRLPILLRRAWFGLNKTFRRRITHLGLTPDQFTAMRTILEGDAHGLAQSQLTELMASDPNTVASLLDRMEAAGLIDRKAHERDRRAYRIRLKPAGLRKYEEARALALDLQQELLAAVPAAKREEFLEHLARVGDACQSAAGVPRRKSPASS